MSNDKPHAEKLAKELKESLAQRRPRPWKLVLATLAISTLILLGLAWWLYPRPKTPPLQVIALDAIFTPGETPIARVQLLAPIKDEKPERWSGHVIVFRGDPVSYLSKENGQTAIHWPVPDGKAAEFFAQYVNRQDRTYSQPDRGRLFVWPKDAPLVMVDADETLIAAQLDENAVDILKNAEKEGWRVVYLSLASSDAHDFRTVRGWIEDRQFKLPRGPVLGRPHYPNDQSAESVRRDLMKNLQNRFQGPMLAVVKSTAAAQVSVECGLKTFLIGDAEVPPQVARVPSWAEVPVRLK